MREISSRQLAWEVLYEVESEGAYSNLLLPRRLRESNLAQRDRAFATELVYGSLRMRGRCDAFIAIAADRALNAIDLKLLIALRLGVYQLKSLEMPVHAAINESVELTKVVAGKSAASFTNAVLRRVVAIDVDESNIEIRTSHPKWIVNAIRDSLGRSEEIDEAIAANNVVAPVTLIAWPGRCELEELIREGAVPIAGSDVAASFEGNPGEVLAVRERRAGVQDYGSQLVVENLMSCGNDEDFRWLDLCAGPGGKAAYLSALIKGTLIANEPSKERAALVSQVLSRGQVTSFDGRAIPEELGKFDRILIDAPCTGLGALRRRPEVRWRRTASDLRALVELQSELLDSAASKLKTGGVIGYATCSPHLAETKLQIRDFLKRNSNFARIPVESKGDLDGDMQLWTHRDGTDSMFLSLLQKRQ